MLSRSCYNLHQPVVSTQVLFFHTGPVVSHRSCGFAQVLWFHTGLVVYDFIGVLLDFSTLKYVVLLSNLASFTLLQILFDMVPHKSLYFDSIVIRLHTHITS